MNLLIQVIVNCVQLGALYTLVAVGLSLIFSVMRIVNFAHAQMYMVGAFAVYLIYGQANVPFVIALVVAAAAAAAIGIAVERVVIRPLQGDESRAMVATLGVLLLLEGLALAIFGAGNKSVTAPFEGSVELFAGAVVDVQKLVVAGIGLALTAALITMLRRTRFGHALRALASNERAARLQGINPGLLRSAGFGLGSALAGVAGGLIVTLTTLSPTIGQPMILKMFIIVVLGGLGSIWGAVAGAFALAAIETAGVTYFGDLSVLGVYVLVMIVLVMKPSGLLSRA